MEDVRLEQQELLLSDVHVPKPSRNPALPDLKTMGISRDSWLRECLPLLADQDSSVPAMTHTLQKNALSTKDPGGHEK